MEDTFNTSHQNNDCHDKRIASEENIVAASELKVALSAENNNTTSSHNSTTITPSAQSNVSKTEINADSETTVKTCNISHVQSDEKQPSKSVEEENEAVTVSTTSTATIESSNEARRLETPAELQDVNNASIEVLLDVSISDRIAGLSIGDGDTSSSASGNHLVDEAKEKPSTSAGKPTTKAPKDKAELSRSILAGEVSDNSECSIEIEEEEASDYDKVDCSGNGISDEEMFIEDQDEDVEEEEEFHEVEEEKHKTSQELISAAGRSGVSPRATLKAPKSASSNSSTKTETPEATTASEKLGENQSKQEPSQQTAPINSAFNETEISLPFQSAAGNDTAELDPQLAPKNVTFSETKQGETQVSANELQSDESVNTKEGAKSTDWANLMLSNLQGSNNCVDGEKASGDQGLETVLKGGDSKEGQKEEENVEKKELDLDEDVKNPQYIPKKGVFYEHDDRSHDVNSKKQPTVSVKNDEDTSETKDSTVVNSSNKKIGFQEKQVDNRRGNRRQRTETDRWGHDLFKDEKQKPKSKSELINAYGYDIRQERSSRNQPSDNRQARGNNSNNNVDRPLGSQDNQRSRQSRDNRRPRENQQPSNRSRDRRSRRPNNNNRNRAENSNSLAKRDTHSNTRSMKPDPKEGTDNKQSFQNSAAQQQTQQASSAVVSNRRDNQDGGPRDRNARYDNRSRRQNSKDRPLSNSADDKSLPPITTVMPPITTWSNKIEDMVKEEASRKESPSRQQHMMSMNNSVAKNRSSDQWPQNTPNKSVFTERPQRIMDENRQQQFHESHQQYTSRRYQDRDEGHKPTQFINRNQYNDGRSNQHNSDWRRTNNYNNTYAKSNEYEPIKTQTFENSRLAQNNMNRSHFRDHRDAREIINERRMQNQNFQQKVQPNINNLEHQQARHQQQQHQHLQQQQQHHQHHQQQQQPQSQLLHHQQILQHQQMFQQQQQANPQQHLRSQQPTVSLLQQQQQQQQSSQQQQASHQQPSQQSASQQLSGQRQQQQQQIGGSGLQSTQSNQTQRQTIGTATGVIASTVNNVVDGVQESGRLNSNSSTSNDLINSRPIVKTDAYNSSNVAQHQQQQQPIQQHSQSNHRSMGASGANGGSHVAQQAPGSSGSHLLASQLSSATGNQPQYYSPTSGSRDPAAVAAALASAYHGYMPAGHSVMDTSRYHMTSQQLSDHGYMTSPGQTNDVATASVLHQQGMYADTTPTGGTVASSAYMAQASSNLSPSANIPVTGAGPPMPPVSYLQHSQYAPPPYSNPYTQPPQPPHNQAPPPPQSTHAYPYWTYI